MKLEVNSQISKHDLKPVFIGSSCTSKVSENSRYYASALASHFFLRYKMRNFVLEKQIVTHMMLLFWNYFLSIVFSPKHWYSVVSRSFLKANVVLLFGHFVGNLFSLL